MRAWVAEAAAAEQEAPPRGMAGLTAPLVGRDEELAILTAVAGRVEREHTPQLVTLFGAAGVGKSRLLAELVDRLPDARVIRGRCLPYGEGITFWPLAEAAKAHAGILDNDPADVALAKLRAAIESVVPEGQAERVVEAAAWTIGLGSSPGTDPLEVVRRLNDGWARYVGGLGREQLTVFAVEDVHWASSALLDLLEQLADNLADTRILLVCTARLELLENRPTWGAGKQNASALTLAPLSAGEATELISSLLGEGQVPPDVRERVLASAEGNPFYLEEMLTMLIEEGALERQNGGWSSTAAARGRLDPGLRARRDRRAHRPPRRGRARGSTAVLRRRPRVLALGRRGRRGRDRLARPQRPRHRQPRLGRRRNARVLVQARAHPRRRVRQPPPPRAARASSPRRRVGAGGGAGPKR